MGVQEQQNMRKVQQKFKMRGLTLTLDALKAVMSHLEEAPNVDQALSDIFSEMDKTSRKGCNCTCALVSFPSKLLPVSDFFEMNSRSSVELFIVVIQQ